MKLKRPTKADFSDIRLVGCFSLSFINKLKKLSDKQEEFLISLSDFINSIEDNLLTDYERKLIEKEFRSKIGISNSVLLLENSTKGTKFFLNKYNLKNNCLICKNNRTQDCHILKRSFFKKQKRLRKHYKLFRNHFSNLVPLCPNHHDLLDKTNNLSQGKINKIILYNKRLVSKMNKDIDKELKKLSKADILIKVLKKKVYKAIRKEVSLILNKI